MKAAKGHATRTRLFILLAFAAGLYVVLPRLGRFSDSLSIIRGADLRYVLAAVAFTGLTFIAAAITYQLLALSQLRYRQTLLVAVASMFTNRLLPAGAGGMATYFLYLRRHKHTNAQAGTVVAVNNLMGTLGHNLLLLLCALLLPSAFKGFAMPNIPTNLRFVFVGIVALIILMLTFKASWRASIAGNARSVGRTILSYRKHPLRLIGALKSSVALTICNVTSLWFCVLAVHASLGLIAALAVFTVGIVASTATPTPGGLGGAEAGFLAGLLAYHVPAAPALAAVLLYRLISYWLTLLTGFLAFIYCENRKFI